MTLRHQDEMTEGAVVAIWLGDHRDELELDEYMSGGFEEEFGFELNERRLPEIDSQAEPVPVAELLRGFSMWEGWHAAAVARCAELGITEAASAMVFHFLRYDPQGCVVAPETEARFIGNFGWGEE